MGGGPGRQASPFSNGVEVASFAHTQSGLQSSADVSVIVPCYNGERYLDQALRCVRRNDRVKLQIVCVNDGSTDATLGIMRAHEAEDSRVQVVDKPNGGYGAAVNAGLGVATGTYVAIAESDDFELPHMYDDLFDLAGVYASPDVIKACYWRVCAADTPRERRYRGYVYGRVRPKRQPFRIEEAPQLLQFHPSIWAGLYRRAFLQERHIRLVEAPGGGWVDNPFLVEVLCQAETIVYTDACHYCYREDITGTSTASRNARVSYARWNDRQDVLDRLQIDDPGVLAANYVVGLKYVEAAIGQGVLERPEGYEATRALLMRMDPSVVSGIADVSPGMLERYARITGNDLPVSKARYGAHLAQEALWGLRYNGPGFVASNVALSCRRSHEVT